LAGATVAKLAGRDPQLEIESGLLRLKQYLETGEIAGTEGRPEGTELSTKKQVARAGHDLSGQMLDEGMSA